MSLPVDTRAAGVRDGWVNTSITPFKGQKYAVIKKALLAKGELFFDPEMPSNNKSLFYSKIDDDIRWMRPAEICKVPKFFIEGMQCDDLEDGEHGNSWFVAACASLSLDQKLWKRVVMKANEQVFDGAQYAGIFHFQIWRLGRWFDVVIDDLLPVKDGQLVFCRSKTRNEFWCSLLEKAYAKIYGDYECLRMCKLTDALVDFTGGVAQTRMITDSHRHDIYHKEKLLNGLFKSLDNKSLVNCEIQCKPSEVDKTLDCGLRKGQPYGITDIKEITLSKSSSDSKKTTLYLIRLSNPRRNGEWSGAWAADSTEWSDISAKDRQTMGLTFSNESEFWLSFEDFVTYFTAVTHCHFMNTSLFSTKKRYSEGLMHGEWTTGATGSGRDRAGGSFTRPTFLRNPQYAMDIPDDRDTLTICLQQDDVSLTRRLGSQSTNIGFYIMKVEDNRAYRVHVPGDKMAESEYEPVREIYMRVQLKRGRYVIIPTTWENDVTGRFLLRTYSTSNINLRPLNEEFPTGRSCMKPYALGTILHVLKVTGMQPAKDKPALNPYLSIKCEGETVKSASIKESNEPTFNFNVIFYRKQPTIKPITIEVYNCNTIIDDLIGTTVLEGNGPDAFNEEEVPLYGKAQKAVAPPEVGKISFEWMSRETFSEL